MDAVSRKILEIDDNQLYSYDGNYSRYLTSRAERENSNARQNDRIKNILRNESEWIKRGPRARAGKDKKRKEKYFDLKNRVTAERESSAAFEVSGKRLGGKILEISNVEKSFSAITAVRDFSFSFKKGQGRDTWSEWKR